MKPSALIAAAAALLAGCASVKVSSTSAADFDFAPAATYAWTEPAPEILNEHDTVLDENLQRHLNRALTIKGWTPRNATDHPDLLVSYHMKIAEHLEYTDLRVNQEPRVTSGITFHNDTRRWMANDGADGLNAYAIEEATLHLILRAPGRADPVWHGTLKTNINRGASPEQLDRQLMTMARKIAAELP